MCQPRESDMKAFFKTPLAAVIAAFLFICLLGAGAKYSGLTQIVGPDPGGNTMQVNSDGSLNMSIARSSSEADNGPQQVDYQGGQQVIYLGYSSATGNATASSTYTIVFFTYSGNNLVRAYFHGTGSLATAWSGRTGYTYTQS
jgi:hypothetical protein